MVLALKGCARRSEIWKKNAPKFLYSSPSTLLGETGALVFHLEFINVLNQGELAPSIPSDTMLLTTWKNKGSLPPEISNPVEHLEDYEILIRLPSSSPETSLWRPRTDGRKPLTPKLGVHTLLRNSAKVQPPMTNNQHQIQTHLSESIRKVVLVIPNQWVPAVLHKSQLSSLPSSGWKRSILSYIFA